MPSDICRRAPQACQRATMDEIRSLLEDEEEMEAGSFASETFSEQERIIEALEREQNMYEITKQPEEKTQQNKEDNRAGKPNKRERVEEDIEEWETVTNKEKRYKSGKADGKHEIYISANEKMPKQFALAKIFKNIGIRDIDKVKYVNPFKIRVDVPNEMVAEVLETCQDIIDRGWRVQRALEVTLSYGVIKDVDLELKDEEIVRSISCPEPGKLVSVIRLLRRRAGGDGWEPSESVRLCFKGSFRPACIFVDGLRIRVDPYIFPVSQCSHCWALGHTTKRCPSTKIICPKCGDHHANCETTIFKCINCGGNHMALLRSCPAYQKEKKLRELMAEFNCTYRRALTLYVPATRSGHITLSPVAERTTKVAPTMEAEGPFTTSQKPSYAEVVTQAIVHKEVTKIPTPQLPKQQRMRNRNSDTFRFEDTVTPNVPREVAREEEKREKDIKFSELTKRLQEIFYLKGVTIQEKVQRVIKCCIEWLILVAVGNITDWPVLKAILELLGMG